MQAATELAPVVVELVAEGHPEHDDAAAALEYVPAEQGVHIVAPSVFE